MDGVVYHPNGEISIEFDGDVYKLRRPKLRQYRWLSERLEELRAETAESLRQDRATPNRTCRQQP